MGDSQAEIKTLNLKLKFAREIYAEKKLEKGILLVDTLEQLIYCVNEFLNQKASGMNVQEYSSKCYNKLISVSERLVGANKIITYHAVAAIKNYAKKQNISLEDVHEKKESLIDLSGNPATLAAYGIAITAAALFALGYDEYTIAVYSGLIGIILFGVLLMFKLEIT